MSPARIWSLPPTEPPPHEIDSGRSRNAASKSSSVAKGDVSGTASASYSPVKRAIGTASPSVTGESLVTMPPSMMSPETSSASPLPRSAPMKRAKPIVPAAPGIFSTMGVVTMPVRSSTCCMARAV